MHRSHVPLTCGRRPRGRRSGAVRSRAAPQPRMSGSRAARERQGKGARAAPSPLCFRPRVCVFAQLALFRCPGDASILPRRSARQKFRRSRRRVAGIACRRALRLGARRAAAPGTTQPQGDVRRRWTEAGASGRPARLRNGSRVSGAGQRLRRKCLLVRFRRAARCPVEAGAASNAHPRRGTLCDGVHGRSSNRRRAFTPSGAADAHWPLLQDDDAWQCHSGFRSVTDPAPICKDRCRLSGSPSLTLLGRRFVFPPP